MKVFLACFFVFVAAINARANAPLCEVRADLPKVKGLIRQVDQINHRLKIKHEEIPNLSMPGMTMTFNLAKECALGSLAAGDKIVFSLDSVDGEYVVLWLERSE